MDNRKGPASPATCSDNSDRGEQQIVFDDDGDLILAFSDGSTIQVSFKVIGTVTTFFDSMRTISARGPYISSFEESEFDALLLFCQICYHRGSEIPVHLSTKEMGDLAVVVTDFDCVDAFSPWFQSWTDRLLQQEPTAALLIDLLSVAFMLGDSSSFRQRSQDLILKAADLPYRPFPISNWLPEPGSNLKNQLPIGVMSK